MNLHITTEKAKRKIRAKIVSYSRPHHWYFKLYVAFWHYKFLNSSTGPKNINYFTAVPNPGAGIGHQMANWIAGYWFARQFGLKFCHTPFSTPEWDRFLGFSENEVTLEHLVEENQTKKVRLPLFDEENKSELNLVKNIIDSYSGQNVVFVAEQDQFYRDQHGVINEIKNKFHNAPARAIDNLVFSKDKFNIAVHVRRGDINVGQRNVNPNLGMRWQDNVYFEKVLSNVIKNIGSGKPVDIYLFSQGKREDFAEFEKFHGITYCLDMGVRESFLHMVNANLLITSKSSFSYKPALLSNGIKVCPKNFWHGYPKNKDWILADENGNFSVKHLTSINA